MSQNRKDDPFARMAAALPGDPRLAPPRGAVRQQSASSYPDVRSPARPASVPPPAPKPVVRRGRMARSEPAPSIAIAGETRPQQATESGPALPSVMVTRPVASPTVRRQIAAPTVRHARPLVMTTGKKSAVLLFLAFSIAVFALGIAGFFYARAPGLPRVNMARKPVPNLLVEAHVARPR